MGEKEKKRHQSEAKSECSMKFCNIWSRSKAVWKSSTAVPGRCIKKHLLSLCKREQSLFGGWHTGLFLPLPLHTKISSSVEINRVQESETILTLQNKWCSSSYNKTFTREKMFMKNVIDYFRKGRLDCRKTVWTSQLSTTYSHICKVPETLYLKMEL